MQIGGRTIQPWQFVLAAAVVVGLIAGGVALLRSQSDSAASGTAALFGDSAQTDTADAANAGVSTDADPKSADASAGNRPGGTTSAGGTGGSGSTSKPSTSKPSTGTSKPAKAGETRKVKVIFWNDTDAKAPSGIEMAAGSYATWKPTGTGNWEVSTMTIPVGKPFDFVVYPDGRSGKKIVVSGLVSLEAVDNSDPDAIHVSVNDTTVRVLGGSIEKFDVSTPRF